jgi:hypothetical protein
MPCSRPSGKYEAERGEAYVAALTEVTSSLIEAVAVVERALVGALG